MFTTSVGGSWLLPVQNVQTCFSHTPCILAQGTVTCAVNFLNVNQNILVLFILWVGGKLCRPRYTAICIWNICVCCAVNVMAVILWMDIIDAVFCLGRVPHYCRDTGQIFSPPGRLSCLAGLCKFLNWFGECCELVAYRCRFNVGARSAAVQTCWGTTILSSGLYYGSDSSMLWLSQTYVCSVTLHV